MRYPSEFYAIEEMRKIQILLEMSLEDDLIFPNCEFPTLTGVTISEARDVLDNWPNCNLEDKITYLAVSGVLGNLFE